MIESCIFCKIAKKEVPARVLFENDRVMAFEDAHPKAPIHIIIIPKEHIEKVSDLTGKDAQLAGELILAANHIARERGIHESGYRIVINTNRDGGQYVFHLHIHLLGGRSMTWPPG